VNWIRRYLTIGSAFAVTISTVILLSTSASAYGAANWQAAFSGNFNSPGSSFGFWGWCDFVGVTSGEDADCALSNYFFGARGASTGFLVAERIQGSAWDVEACSPGFCLAPDTQDFFITDGTVVLSGPNIAQMVKANFVPPGCTVSGATATCPIPVLEGLGFYTPDTGIPAAAGHYAFSAPGSHIMIQVIRIR